MRKLLLGCLLLLVAAWGVHTQPFMEARMLATLGNAQAQFNLGRMYYEGQATPKNDQAALQWFLKAAAQNNANAQFSLGSMYGQGIGVAGDDIKAVEWYSRAAEQGHSAAQYNLAARYYNGEGVPKNVVLAYMWADLSARQGQLMAIKNKERLVKEMTPEQLTKAQQMSGDWLAKHSQR